jgi:DNA-binding NarL/FixJ family response regulator
MKVLLVDDHTLFREGLRLLLERMPGGFEVLEAADCSTAFELIKVMPDLGLVLLDLGLPDMPGLQALDLMRTHYPAIPVVVISAAQDRPTVLEAINHGAMGFIPKSSGSALLVSALQMVLAREVYIPASVITNPLHAVETTAQAALVNKSAALRDLGLSDRQIEVLSLLVQGLPNKLIARKLGLAEPTVKSHVAATFRALGVGNRTQAVLAVGQLGYRFI